MLGFSQIKIEGKLVRLGSSCFSAAEVIWLKSLRPNMYEQVARVATLLLSLMLFMMMYAGKGTFVNPEYLIVFAGFYVGMQGLYFNRIATSGDVQEIYDSRFTFDRAELIRAGRRLNRESLGWVFFKQKNYDYWVNLNRLAWFKPDSKMDYGSAAVALLCWGYHTLIGLDLPTAEMELVKKLAIFSFPEGGRDNIEVVVALLGILAMVSFFLSFRRGVLMGSIGGVVDFFAITESDLKELVDRWNSFLERSPDAMEPYLIDKKLQELEERERSSEVTVASADEVKQMASEKSQATERPKKKKHSSSKE